jgi:hypothetical protein
MTPGLLDVRLFFNLRLRCTAQTEGSDGVDGWRSFLRTSYMAPFSITRNGRAVRAPMQDRG